MSLGSIRAVLFDAGSTLLEVKPSVGSVYSQVAEQYGVMAPPTALEEAFRAEWRRRTDPAVDDAPFGDSDETQRQWWRSLVEATFAPAGGPDAFAGHFSDYFEELYELFAQPKAWEVYDDVAPALEVLRRRGFRLGVVSNWDNRLPRLMRGLKLDRYFEFILTSAEAGCKKPFPGIFEQAVARLGVMAREAVYVGDSVDHDVVGARGAGLVPVQIARKCGKTAQQQGGHAVIHSLRDLPGMLG
ncbi:MAG: HAD-IA family hydrolase [Candidatus Hydrogenedentes bacterium]|nr:HAD-IA family hydrolase [Candidatus Hydrogenedentota bacterium]